MKMKLKQAAHESKALLRLHVALHDKAKYSHQESETEFSIQKYDPAHSKRDGKFYVRS